MEADLVANPAVEELLAQLASEGLDKLDLEIARVLLSREGERQLRCLTAIELGVTASGGQWVPYDCHFHLHEKLLDVACDRVRNLLLSWPPQHGKTQFTSIYWVAWMLGNFPDWRIGIISYSAEIAEGIGDQVLTLIDRWGMELWGIKVSPRKRSAARFDLLGHRGGLIAVGVDGSLTGRRIDLLIIDDPFKGRKEAQSPSMREDFKTKYVGSMLSRLSKKARKIIIQTRWHDDDPIGWLLQEMAEGGEFFEYCNLPAVAPYPDEIPEDEHHLWFPDPLGRQPGEALCPELHPIEQFEPIMRLKPDLWWALYQGRPTPGAGGFFEETWWQYWEDGDLPCAYDPRTDTWNYLSRGHRWDDIGASWDAKFKATESGAWCVGSVWGKRGPNRYLLDVVRGRWGVDGMCDAVIEMKRKWPILGPIVVEAKAGGPKVVKRLKGIVPGFVLWTPEGDKAVRTHAQTYLARGGNIWIPRPSRYGWVQPWKKEMEAFPNGLFKDQVDSYTQMQEYWEDNGPFVAPKQKLKPVNPLARYLK